MFAEGIAFICVCRAMPRCYAFARPMPSCVSVRLCVFASVTFVNSVKTSNQPYPRTIFTVGQPNHSSFCLPNLMAIFRRRPPHGGVQCRWGRLKSRFSTNISLCDRLLLHHGQFIALSGRVFVDCRYRTTKRHAYKQSRSSRAIHSYGRP